MIAKQLFNLVKAALWQTAADASLFGEQTDWQAIYKLARKQTVMGIAYDGMLTLPAELQPQRALKLQWSNALMQCEDNNHLLNQRIETLFCHYQAAGLKPLLLKGQGVAQCYPHPEHRQPGDIDVYIGEQDYERANRLLAELGGEIESESVKHSHGHWQGVTVENHYLLTQFASPSANRPNGRISGRWYTFTQTVKRCREYYTLAPTEACWHPLKLIKTFVMIRLNRWFS